jgi:KDO2-lipid IV(A) lauroyltransferase
MRPVSVRVARWLQQANYWWIAQVAFGFLWLLRRLPPERALSFADRAARRVGPWFGRHRVAIHNLTHAYPEKSREEIERIASDMWGNMARLAVEYLYLDLLLQRRPGEKIPDRLEVVGDENFLRLQNETGKPHILFTGHLGNFELLPIAGALFGVEATVMFRPPNNPYIADYIARTRGAIMNNLVPSTTGVVFTLARVLESGGNVGVLVDQKLHRGSVRTTFFGRPCETSTLLPKLARQFDCDVYPAYSVRLPDNRFRLVLEAPLTLPRDAGGKIAVTATAQLLNDIVERWVRENPGQWTWFHKRWTLSHFPRANRGQVGAGQPS